MWNPIDTHFYRKKLPVSIVNIDYYSMAPLYRQILEDMGAVVHLHNIDVPTDFIQVIGQEECAPPYMIIASHGEENGIVFGDYMSTIDTSMLVEGIMPFDYIAKHIKLPRTFIVNLACYGGTPETAKAFMSGGIVGYIGTDPNPNAVEHPLFISHFFHSLIRRKMSPIDAWKKAAAYDNRSRRYIMYDAEGKHQVE